MGTEPDGPALPASFKIMSEELQGRQLKLHAQDDPVDDDHHQDRDNGRQHKGLSVPNRLVGRQAVAVVVHHHAYILEHRVAQNVAGKGADQRDQYGQDHVVADQLFFCITRRPEGPNHGSLPCDRVAGCHCKYEGQDHDDDVEEHNHHPPVTAHIFTGEDNGLIGKARNICFHLDFLYQRFHKIFRHGAGLNVISRRIIVHPGIIARLQGAL